MKAVVLNYGVGNLFSISSALRKHGLEVEILNEPKEADLVVLPGVGAFNAVGTFLERWRDELNELRKSGTRFLGVCLGMQVLFEEGNEGGRTRGLGWLPGRVDLLVNAPKLPHIGWDVLVEGTPCEMNEGLQGKYAYFVHSYVAYTPEKPAMTSVYGVEFPALVCKGEVVGTQFHPEKSGETGKVFFSNLMRWLKT
ncbi:imidazole glycerol phosphate synthase subunit HisH [Metallosphaera tengchongensis]|uniref:Imidazole glycerol phosphate synthase subunit HisH n=1 Tax=Metallosphaera tengchongensis TaxID=1532350 RepID=A0A6N0NWM5_9CREN|nr:imidazole glycerol phosphate synthase subunit HisH [Metallosphaera tengchongensis]QKQ99539.1 imidazole glycerol phosphate synthase subunit HisH [Metallosphaera tengchongensis]